MRHSRIQRLLPRVLVGLMIGLVVSGASSARSAEVSAEVLAEPEWLAVANLYRASAGLTSVVENPEASRGAVKHSEYINANHLIAHDEDPTRPSYSIEGRRAGLTGNVANGSGGVVPAQRYLIEEWMTAPFHGLAMLNRDATSFGFGSSSDAQGWGSTLSVGWDGYAEGGVSGAALQQTVELVLAKHPDMANRGYRVDSNGTRAYVVIEKRRFTVVNGAVSELLNGEDETGAAVVWPGPGSKVPLNRYFGGEYPDPVVSCAGWSSRSSGLPILIRRGRPLELRSVFVTNSQGTAIDVCSITADTYRSPDATEQTYARSLLRGEGSAIIVPKVPLVFGETYRVVAKSTSGETFDWSFGVSTDGAIHPPADSPLATAPTPGVPSQGPGSNVESQTDSARLDVLPQKVAPIVQQQKSKPSPRNAKRQPKKRTAR
jgi:Cysteine-rich secretory protein family